MNKPRPARPLADLAQSLLAESFRKQGFAAAELITRWPEIAGADIAAHAEPERIRWPRTNDGNPNEPATLVLRVEGPTAIEIQHQSAVIIERVNRFLGWKAIGQIALRQAPLSRREKKAWSAIDPEAAARVAGTLKNVSDENLRQALARLGVAVKQK